ncbi:MAG: glycosyltransferase [Planctomycetes bacterium]|nr:glycosyltransferase [Planctomycetota bacterium]
MSSTLVSNSERFPAAASAGAARRPVRVCFLIEQLLAGGTQLWCLRLIQGLDRSRVAPLLCLLDGEDELSRSLEPSDCPVLRLGVQSLRSPWAFRQAWRLARFLREQRVDVLQVHHADPTYFGLPAARMAGVPRVVHTWYNLGHNLTARDRRLTAFCARFLDGAVANCRACKESCASLTGASPQSIAVLENGVDLDAFASIAPLSPRPEPRPVTGMVANLSPVKEPELLVRAARLVLQTHPHAEFRIAGVGDLQQPLERLIEDLGLRSRFVLAGRVSDIPAFLSDVRIGVLCSRAEGLPHAVLEYMAAGRPSVVTAVGGNVELIRDGVEGLVTPPGDAEGLASALRRMLDDPRRAAEMGAAARRRVAAHYSRDAMLRRFEQFYCDLVSRPRGSFPASTSCVQAGDP